jgi:hypothetical protein
VKWIEARLLGPSESGKTQRFEIVTRNGGVRLGEVRWFGRWRQYVFCPDGDTVYEQTCLDDLRGFLAGLMAERRRP